MELRNYQKQAKDAVYAYWQNDNGDNPIVVMPTGSGKSLVIASIIQDAVKWNSPVIVLSHVRELLEQNAKELWSLYPESEILTGFYSAGLKEKTLGRPITIAGIQSIYEKAFDIFPAPELVIVDEAHLVPRDEMTRYGKFLNDLKKANPKIKIVGFTATPFRLDSGMLHEGENAIFDGIAHEVEFGKLVKGKYLVAPFAPVTKAEIDLSNVQKRAGEFVSEQVEKAAMKDNLVEKVVDEIRERGQFSKSWLIFAAGVKHGMNLADEIASRGYQVGFVEGKTPMSERDRIFKGFRERNIRALVNVNVATTGFNAPGVDLVALVRATTSPGLYIQMVGRGTRPAAGKEDCLLLDFGGNVRRHGFIDDPKIKKPGKGDGIAPAKECPNCHSWVPAGCLVCPYCAHDFPKPKPKYDSDVYNGAVTKDQAPAEWHDVNYVEYMRHQKQDKPDSIRVVYGIGLFGQEISEWLCPDHGGYATELYRIRMKDLNATAKTVDGALLECNNWRKPSRIKTIKNGKYHEIVQLDYFQPETAVYAPQIPPDDDIPF